MNSHVHALSSVAVSVAGAARMLNLSRATIYRLAQSDPQFPRIRKFGRRASRVLVSELLAWAQKQSEGAHG
jgi:predicted DNA-binding transcriptional regulator AlpA